MHSPESSEDRFERAVDAVVDGDVEALQAMLRAHPELAHARSTRVTDNDPPVHRATLLHYLGANGVEAERQRTPANAVEVLSVLIDAGADANALADLYGGQCATLSLLVSSWWPAEAGVQAELARALVAAGADLEGSEATAWRSPLLTALTFGYRDTAEALVHCGAAVDTLPKAAGLGYAATVRLMLAEATPLARHQALAVAATNGALDVVQLLAEAGEDLDRHNPPGFHAHQTPLHAAAQAGNLPLAQLLVSLGARLDRTDTIFGGTPLGWAEHAGKTQMAEYLRDVARGGA